MASVVRVTDPHRILGDRYEVLSSIGTGASADVFRVRDVRTGAVRAAKVLKTGQAAAPDVLARFEDEFRILRALHHPHLPEVYDYGWTANGERLLIMELVDGEPLDRYFESHPEDIWVLLYEICETLVFVHGRDLLHQDIKPSNILVSRSADRPVIKLIDFGLTYRRGVGAKVKLVGTAEYIAPEVVRGEAKLTRAVDYYSLGATLFELLCGAPPFVGAENEVLRAHLEREPVIESEELEWAELYPHVRALLRKDASARLGAFEEFRRAVVGRLTGGIEDLDRAYALARIDSLGTIGKSEALSSLLAWLGSAGAGASHTASVSGTAGVGKRFLCDAVRAEASLRGIRSLTPADVDTARADSTVARQPALMWSRLLEICEREPVMLVVERPASLPDEERSFVRLAGTQWELMRSRGRVLPLYFLVAVDTTTDDGDVLDYLPSEGALKIELGALTKAEREQIVSQFRGSMFDSRDARGLLTYLGRFEDIGSAVQGLQQAVLRSALTFVGQRWKVQPSLLSEMVSSRADESFSRDLVASLSALEQRIVAVVAAHPEPVPVEWVASFASVSTDEVPSIIGGSLKRLCVMSSAAVAPSSSSVRAALRAGSDPATLLEAHQFLVSMLVRLDRNVSMDRALAYHLEQWGQVRDAARVHLRLLRTFWAVRPRERPYELIEGVCRSGLELLEAHGRTVTVPTRRHLFCFYLKQWINALWARNLFTHAKPIIDEWTKRLNETMPASVAPRYVRSVLELEGPEAALGKSLALLEAAPRAQLRLRLLLEQALANNMRGDYEAALQKLDCIVNDAALSSRDRYRLQIYRAMNLDEIRGMGSMQEVLEPLAEAASQAACLDEATLIYALKARGSISHGSLQKAVADIARGLRVAHKGGLVLRENLFNRLAATAYGEMCRATRVTLHLERALRLAGTIGMRYVVAVTWARLSENQMAIGRWGNASRYSARAIELMGEKAPEKELNQALAFVYAANVMLRTANRRMSRVENQLRNSRGSTERGYYHLWRGRDLVYRKRFIDARDAFTAARADFVRGKVPFNVAWADLQLARIHLLLRDRASFSMAMRRAKRAMKHGPRPLINAEYRIVELKGRYLFREPLNPTLAMTRECQGIVDSELDLLLRVELVQTLVRIHARANRIADAQFSLEEFQKLVSEVSANSVEVGSGALDEVFSLSEFVEELRVLTGRSSRGDQWSPRHSRISR